MCSRTCCLAALLSISLLALCAEADDIPLPAPDLPTIDGDALLREPSRVLRRGDQSDVVDELPDVESVVPDAPDLDLPEVPAPAPSEVPEPDAIEVPEPEAIEAPDPEPRAVPVPMGPGSPDAVWGPTYDKGGCGSCGGGCASPCGPPGRLWIRGEYLLWWTKGMFVPPLVTGGPDGATRDRAGVLPQATILYGGESVLEDARSGFRIRAGGWLDDCQRFGLQGEYFGLGTESESFSRASDATGNPILARPFFNINPRDRTGAFTPPARNASQLVSFPDELAGRVTVDVNSSLHSAAAHFRMNVCCKTWCTVDPCNPCCVSPGSSRFDFLLGYRYARLNETVQVREDLRTLDLNPQREFVVFDRFGTSNDFNGFELGVLWDLHHKRWFVEAGGRIALGNNHQIVDIFGTTTETPPGDTLTGGLLASQTNIGHYSRNDFAVIPQLDMTLGYHLTRRLSLTVGYTFFYWGRVARPGEQIELDINPDYLPGGTTAPRGAGRPRFVFQDTDFWAQGLNFGLDYRW